MLPIQWMSSYIAEGDYLYVFDKDCTHGFFLHESRTSYRQLNMIWSEQSDYNLHRNIMRNPRQPKEYFKPTSEDRNDLLRWKVDFIFDRNHFLKMMEQTINFEKTLKCNLHHCRLEKKELKAHLSDYGKNLYRNNQVFSLQLN